MRFDRLKRREFVALLGGVAAWPLAATAQQAGKLPTVGMLGSSFAAFGYWIPALLQRLHELGWIENRTMAMEYRWTEGRSERYAQHRVHRDRATTRLALAGTINQRDLGPKIAVRVRDHRPLEGGNLFFARSPALKESRTMHRSRSGLRERARRQNRLSTGDRTILRVATRTTGSAKSG